jgi:hypothetical protein
VGQFHHLKITNNITKRIAYFISPHGYGHAARASAVMMALQARDPDLHIDIFTQVPDWFFEESLAGSFSYHPVLTDIGLVQVNSLVEDMPATLARLAGFLPFDQVLVKGLAAQLNQLQPACRLVICDIAPLGIAVARAAGLPALLVENFTWDWIYQGYESYQAQLNPYIDYLHQQFESADYHIQTEPVSAPKPVDLTAKPVSRKIRMAAGQVRQKLGLPEAARFVLLSMGGVAWDYSFLEGLEARPDLYFVTADSSRHLAGPENLILLQRDSGLFHPDLVNACDAIIGKVGYSTLAEAYQAGVPFGYIARPAFRESPVLVDYIEAQMPARPLLEADLYNGRWLDQLPELLALPRVQRHHTNGADQIADFVYNLID